MASPRAEDRLKSLGGVLARQGIFIAFIIFLAGFAIFSDKFLTAENLLTVVRQSAIIGVMAVGVTVVVIGGNLDLSVGSLLSFSTVMVVDLHDKIGAGPAILIMFAAALTIGAMNGLLVGVLRLNSLIVTLGMLSAIQGLTLIYSGGKNVDIVNQEETWFAIFGRGSILGVAKVHTQLVRVIDVSLTAGFESFTPQLVVSQLPVFVLLLKLLDYVVFGRQLGIF